MTNEEIVRNYNFVIFEAEDVNDPTWHHIIKVLKDNIPDFQLGYGDGDYMSFAIPKETKEQKEVSERQVNTRNEKLAKLYDYIGRDLAEYADEDLYCGFLTENTGSDGNDYFWYFDDDNDVAIEINTGRIVTDSDEIGILFE